MEDDFADYSCPNDGTPLRIKDAHTMLCPKCKYEHFFPQGIKRESAFPPAAETLPETDDFDAPFRPT